MSPRASDNEIIPKYMASCASCGIRFEVSKAMHAKIKEDEFLEFVLDPRYKRSLLIATVYLPRCPACTNGMLKAAEKAKIKLTVPVLLFEEREKIDKAKIAPVPEASEDKATA